MVFFTISLNLSDEMQEKVFLSQNIYLNSRRVNSQDGIFIISFRHLYCSSWVRVRNVWIRRIKWGRLHPANLHGYTFEMSVFCVINVLFVWSFSIAIWKSTRKIFAYPKWIKRNFGGINTKASPRRTVVYVKMTNILNQQYLRNSETD